jgi:hypothetical protein
MIEMMLLSPAMPTFWLFFLYFLVTIIVAFVIPGLVVLGNSQKNLFFRLTIGCVLGMTLWGLQGVLFGYMHIRWISYVYVIFFNGYFFLRCKIPKFKFPGLHIPIALIVVGLFVQMTPIWNNGFVNKDGLQFLGKLPVDAISYVSMTSETIARIPPYNPNMTGTIMHNYHYLMNVIVGELIRVFHLPLITTQLSFYPIFISILSGLTIWVFVETITKQKSLVPWFLFWHYFSGDLTVSLTTFSEWGRFVTFLPPVLADGTTFMVNLYRSTSFGVLMAALTVFVWWMKSERLKTAIIAGILFGALISIKVYMGIFAIIGLGIVSLYRLLKHRVSIFSVTGIAIALSLVLYLPVNSGAGGLYWSGFWRVENYVSWSIVRVKPELLSTVSYLTKQKRLLHQPLNVVTKTLGVEALFIILYLALAYGTKWLSLVQAKKYLKEIPIEVHLFLVPSMILCILLGLFTMQTSGGGHTDNFLNIAGLIMSFYAAYTCVTLAKSRKVLFRIFLAVVILMNIVPVVRNTFGFPISYPLATESTVISNAELRALQYLRTQTPKNSVVLVDPDNYLDNLASYVTMLSQRGAYLSAKFLLGLNNTSYVDRKNYVDSIMAGKSLINHPDNIKIDYIYVKRNSINLQYFLSKYQTVFENEEVVIFKFDTYPATVIVPFRRYPVQWVI